MALSVPIGPAVFSVADGFVLAVCHLFPVVLSGLLSEWKVDEGGNHGTVYEASVYLGLSFVKSAQMYSELLKMPERQLLPQIQT